MKLYLVAEKARWSDSGRTARPLFQLSADEVQHLEADEDGEVRISNRYGWVVATLTAAQLVSLERLQKHWKKIRSLRGTVTMIQDGALTASLTPKALVVYNKALGIGPKPQPAEPMSEQILQQQPSRLLPD